MSLVDSLLDNGVVLEPSAPYGGPEVLELTPEIVATTYDQPISGDPALDARRRRAMEIDHAIFERVALDRNEHAFGELYDRFSERVYSLLLHMLHSEEDAQDLMQEIFVLIWNKAPEFYESRGNPAAWILTLARNRAVDEMRSKRYRKRKSEQSFGAESHRSELNSLVETQYTPEAEFSTKEVQSEIHRALKILNPDQREAIHLAYFAGMTYSEIAERKGIPLSTVKSRIRQSVMKLGDVVKPRF